MKNFKKHLSVPPTAAQQRLGLTNGSRSGTPAKNVLMARGTHFGKKWFPYIKGTLQ